MTRTPSEAGAGSVAAAMNAMYRVLGSLFLPPTDERMATLVTAVPELRRLTAPLDGLPGARAWASVLDDLASVDDDELARMGSDFTSMFLSGSRELAVQPYESSHVQVSEYDVATVSAAVESCYRRAGVEPTSRGELPDHLAVELEFCAYLCHREGEADDGPSASRWRADRAAFLTEHLLRWVDVFATEISRAQPASRYAPWAAAARAVAEDDLIVMDALRAGTPAGG